MLPAYAHEPFTQGVSPETKSFASSLSTPYCGVHVSVEAVRWLQEPVLAASLALIPLRDADKPGAPAFGLLVLASPDASRYQDNMATDYLEHIGKMASAALSRLTPTATALQTAAATTPIDDRQPPPPTPAPQRKLAVKATPATPSSCRQTKTGNVKR